MLVSMVTILFVPTARIQFGVLTLIGSCMLLMTFLDVFLQKVSPILGIVVCAVLFFLTLGVNSGYIGYLDSPIIQLPREWYANWVTTYIGFPESGFYSTDYYTFLPWLFMYVIGYFLYRIVFLGKKEKILQKSICPPLGWIGRHALVIYMLHQPIIYGVLSAIYTLLQRKEY